MLKETVNPSLATSIWDLFVPSIRAGQYINLIDSFESLRHVNARGLETWAFELHAGAAQRITLFSPAPSDTNSVRHDGSSCGSSQKLDMSPPSFRSGLDVQKNDAEQNTPCCKVCLKSVAAWPTYFLYTVLTSYTSVADKVQMFCI